MSNDIPRPFASAHRAGNSRAAAMAAIEAGADLLETDIWLHKGRLELRHKETLGPIPILWERWAIAPGWRKRYVLRDLLQDTPETTLLFLDFKGSNMDLGPAVLRELDATAPERTVAICGRNYPLLQTIANDPRIICFYSVGDDTEWPVAQQLIAASEAPALSIRADLATPDRLQWMNERGGVVVCWDVNSVEEMERLRAAGVDGFTTDHFDLLEYIRALRHHTD